MQDLYLYYTLDTLIKEEIDREQKIAIFPYGRAGMMAMDILNKRYGRTGIVIDNNLVMYNSEIVNLEQYKETIDDSGITIILCAIDYSLNEKLMKIMRSSGIKARIRNVLLAHGTVVPAPGKGSFFSEIRELCRVKKAVGYDLVKAGNQFGDGGYVMLNDFKDSAVAYSFGIGTDISWDKWLAEQGGDVYCYDHTIDALPEQNPKLFFNKLGIAGKDEVEENLLSMKSIIHKNGHDSKRKMILKMDVEGAEWEFLATTDSSMLDQFSQISFELHRMTNTENKEKIITCLKKIRETHYPIWVHGNNNGRVESDSGIVMPNLLEITYANRNDYDFVSTDYDCPLDIDVANINEHPDIVLKGWGDIMCGGGV